MSSDAVQVRNRLPSYFASGDSREVPHGFVDTEAGLLPSDWRVKKLGELATFRTGPFGSALHKSDYIEGGIPLINPTHIVDGALAPESETSVSERASNRLADFRLRADDIVIGRRGDMGRCAVVRDSEAGWLCGTGSLIIRCSGEVDVTFLQRVLTTERVVGMIESSSVGSTMVNLNQAALARLSIQCPPPPEQRAIAEALSDVDGLLRALEALIAKKRAIKQAAMQQLLTGTTRLPGFRGEWKDDALGTVVEGLDAGVSVKSTEGEPSPGRACVLKTSALAGGVFFPEEAKRIDHRDILRARTSPMHDTILISRMNTPDLVGEVAFVSRDYPWLFLPDRVWMTRFRRQSDLNVRWLAYVLSDPIKHRSLGSLATGTSGSMKNIPKSALLALTIQFPKIEEQDAIASVLSDIDGEIAALEARRDKTRAIKQGMMQQLLTGRVRLVEPEQVEATA